MYEYYYKMGYGVDVYNGLIEEVARQLHLEFTEALALLNKMHVICFLCGNACL